MKVRNVVVSFAYDDAGTTTYILIANFLQLLATETTTQQWILSLSLSPSSSYSLFICFCILAIVLLCDAIENRVKKERCSRYALWKSSTLAFSMNLVRMFFSITNVEIWKFELLILKERMDVNYCWQISFVTIARKSCTD